MRVNHNIAAINAHRQIGILTEAYAKSVERLSSGSRINRAGDDAAGLAISEKMRAQIRGLRMASRNAADTISLIQTAEGALGETHEILQRIRELAVQSANDTNTDADRRELQAEVKQLLAEIDRIGNTTEFNTKKLIDGSRQGVAEEVAGELRVNNNSSLSIDPNQLAEMVKTVSSDKGWALGGAYMLVKTNQSYDANSNAVFTAKDLRLIGPMGQIYDFTDNTVTIDGTYSVTLGENGESILFSGSDDATLAADFKSMAVGESVTFVFSKYQSASSDLGNSLMAQIGANSGQTLFVSIGDMRCGALDIKGIDISTKWGAATAIETVSDAIAKVSHQRSLLGAIQNRLEHTIRNLDTAAENLEAAESRIRDVDMVKEMMEFTKLSILLQAAQAMLAQANQQPKRVLELLNL